MSLTHRTRGSWWWRGLVLLFAPMCWLVLPAPVASAHATLLATTPPAGYAVPSSPTALTLDFDEPVSIGSTPLGLTTTAGDPRTLGSTRLSLGDRRLSAPIPTRLAVGGYRVAWQVTATDGDLVSGTFTFAVGPGGVPVAQGGVSTVDPPVVIVLRWLLFAGLALGLGGGVGEWLIGRVRREAAAQGTGLPPVGSPALAGTTMGGLAALGLGWWQVGPDLLRLGASAAGRLVAVEVFGFVIGVVLLLGARRWPLLRVAAGMPLLAVVGAEGLRAHPHAANPLLGAAITIVHLLAACGWIGALAQVVLATRRWRTAPGWARLVAHDYARLAVLLVVALLATGTLAAVLLLPSLDALVNTTYGVALLLKLGFVAGALTTAVLARHRLRRRPVGRTIGVEVGVLAGVLAITAVLVSMAPPAPATTELAAPPPPVGPVVPAGTLAGQVTVTASASSGQLVVRLATPAADAGGPETTAFQATAQLDHGSAKQALALRGCGEGCFTAPADWATGINRVRLTITAPPWQAGAALLDIPWPPHVDPTLMPAVLAAMRATGSVTLHQAVTSDYTGDPGAEQRLAVTGGVFVANEPYGNGGGAPVVLATDPGETEIGLSFPEGIVVRLWVDAYHRILREQDTTHNHLITSTVDYG